MTHALWLVLIAGTLAGQPPANRDAAPPTAPTATAPATPDFDPLRAAIRKYVKAIDLPGASLIILKDDKVAFREHLGAYDDATVVSLASATKWLSGAAMMALVDEGKLDLDAPISNYLKEFEGKKAGRVTVRQCMSHTSGLVSEHPSEARPLLTLEECVKEIAKEEPVEEPGKVFRYAGAPMQVAGRVAEVAAGKPWRDIFDQKIAKPLGMKSTQYGRFGVSQNPNLAGGALSTLDDYTKFMRMIAGKGQVDGVRVLSERAVEEMCADQTRGATVARGAQMRLAEPPRYGIGNWVNRRSPDGKSLANSSPGAFGFTPAINWDQNLVVIFMIENRQRERRKAADLPNIQREIQKIYGQ